MAYTEKSIAINRKVSQGATAEVLTAAAAHGEDLVFSNCKITRIGFVVTVEVACETVAPIVTFKKRITPGSDTGSSTIGTLTIPDGTAVGKVLYKNVTPVELAPGDAIEMAVSTAGTGAAAAGSGYYVYEVIDCPEHVANLTDMVASA
jgi:hypothetical protein